jgi:hypothetical protein
MGIPSGQNHRDSFLLAAIFADLGILLFDAHRIAFHPHYRSALIRFDSHSGHKKRSSKTGSDLERSMGIEPTSSAWKAEVIAIIRRSRDEGFYIQLGMLLSRVWKNKYS